MCPSIELAYRNVICSPFWIVGQLLASFFACEVMQHCQHHCQQHPYAVLWHSNIIPLQVEGAARDLKGQAKGAFKDAKGEAKGALQPYSLYMFIICSHQICAGL